MDERERDKLIDYQARLDPETLSELDEEVREDVLDQLDSKEIAAAARELETDDAATIFEDLTEEERQKSWPSCRPTSAPRSKALWPTRRTPPGA